MKRAWKIFALVGLVIFVLFLASAVYAVTAYPTEYVRRVVLWGYSDVNDYRRFPEHPIEASPNPFYFDQKPDAERVRTLFERDPLIDDLDSFLANNGTQAFIVIQDDTVLYEKYFNETQRDSIVTSFSVAKSFVSALIGVAIAEGHISSVNDPITDYLPELADRDPAFGDITIRDLLMMSSGIDYSESFLPFPFESDLAKAYYYPDLRKLALEHTRIGEAPGESFLYNNYNPLLLGLIIERSTGTSVGEYLQQKIWQPLGMEFPGSWSLDSESTRFEKMESGINARAIDFAKFGRLYLNNGNWDGEQVVPAEWVAESTQADTSVNRASYYPDEEPLFSWKGGYYGYMWWGVSRGENEYDYFAVGDHGQYIYISPHKGLIIVRNGEEWGFDHWVDAMFYEFASDL